VRVLVDREAGKKDLDAGGSSSWEHGLIRARAESKVPRGGIGSVARSQADAPDIDGRVMVRERLVSGEFAEVRIVDHTDYDLLAEAVDP
jgi:hypothetical protein